MFVLQIKFPDMGIIWTLLAGLCCRLGLVLYGEWQDQNMAVKFTDIDYHVFTDAAAFIAKVGIFLFD